MKIWLFYRIRANLEPTLYAYTDKKEYAELFSSGRTGFYCKEKDVSKAEYRDMTSNVRNMAIELHEFTTSAPIGKRKVLQIATTNEIQNIILNKESILLRELERYVLPIEIFNDECKKVLIDLGFSEVSKYQEVAYMPYDEDHVDFKFDIDEYALFAYLYRDTLIL